MAVQGVVRAPSFSLLWPPPLPNPAVRPVPKHPRTRKADGTGGSTESPVHAGDRVPHQGAQHSVLQRQAAAGVVRHHFAEQVPAAGEREVSPGAGPRGPGKGLLARNCLPVLEAHHGCLHLRRPDAQTGCLLSSAANRKLAGQPLREAELECRRSPVSVSPELRLFSAVRRRLAQYRADAVGS